MHPDKRRRGRQIRKTRRTFARLAARFGELGKAATLAATSISAFGVAVRAAARREEELAANGLLRAEDAS